MIQKVKRLGLNFFLSVLVLSPILGYIGYSSVSLHLYPLEKAPFIHWSGIDPHHEVYVTWETGTETGSYVKYGTESENLDQVIENSTKKLIHTIHLFGLTADTQYYYQVGPSPDAVLEQLSEIQTFTTAPVSPKDFSAMFFSDTQQIFGLGGYDKVGKAIDKMGDAAFASCLGDFVQNHESKQEWNQFFDESPYLDRIPLVPVAGNHDGIDTPDNMYSEFFGFTENGRDVFYSFNWSNTQFIVAQFANRAHMIRDDPRNDANFEWLNKTLENGQGMDFRVLLYHIHRDVVVPIVEKYNVSLAIHGHAHQYTRRYMNNHTYLCLGNGATIQETVIEREDYYQAECSGVGFTRLNINATGIEIQTFTPTLEIMDAVFLRRESPTSGILVPDKII